MICGKHSRALLLLISVFLASAVAFSVDTLSPLQNAEVSVDGDNGQGFASTGPDGTFKPLELGAGNYTVQIRHEGYVSKMLNATITAGVQTNLGDVELDSSGKIQGIVKNPSGDPASNIQVLCQDELTHGTVFSVMTSSDGSFTFDTDIKNGTYTIQAILSIGYPPDPSFAGYASNMTAGIEASEGQTTSGVVVQLRPSGTIMGTVKDKSNVSIANVNVGVDPQDGLDTVFSGGFSITDAQGEYAIDRNLPTGNYKVYIADAKGFIYSYLDYVNATVTAGQNTTVDFALDHSGIISGAVNLTGGGPAADITVSAVSSDFKYEASAQTDSGGLYRIESGLGTGQYTVMAANDYANMKTVNVTAGAETPNVDFQVTRNLAWINGTVLNSTGGPIYTASLQAVSEGIFAYSYVDYYGNYTMEVQLPPGQDSAELNVTVSAKGYFSSSQNVTVNREQTTSPVDFTLQTVPVGTLTGRVVAAVPYSPPRTIGVSAGSTFNYTVAFSMSSTDPNATLPPYFAFLNDTEWISTSILAVSSTSVTLQMTMHFKNGTDSTQTGVTDVTTGDGNITNWVVASNLNPNDTVYTSGMYSSWAINETIVRTYPSGARNTNHLNMSTETNVTGVYQYSSTNFYWDKSTGVMVEMSMATITQTNPSQTNMSVTVKIAESNAWVVPEIPTLTPMLVFLILLTAAVIFRKRRLPKTLAHQTTSLFFYP